MNQPVKKTSSYFNLLVVLLGLTVSVVLVAATLLIKNKPAPADTAVQAIEQRPLQYAARELPCGTIEQPDTTVKHPARRFNNATINTVLDSVRNWYGVLYAFQIPVNNRFTGTIPKDASLNETLRLLVTMTPDSICLERTTPGQIIVNPKCP